MPGDDLDGRFDDKRRVFYPTALLGRGLTVERVAELLALTKGQGEVAEKLEQAGAKQQWQVNRDCAHGGADS